MKNITRILLLMICALLAASVSADEAAVRKSIAVFMPQGKVESVKPAEIPGLFEVIASGDIFYVSDDGRYLLHGQLYDALGKKNITESKLGSVRLSALAEVGEQNMIIFKPENSKHTVSIFTDIDCGYCRKLHSEIDQYMALGITIRYLFFPRAGKGSESYKKAVSVWCAADRNKALTDAKKGGSLDNNTCENPVDKHMALGEQFGMQGTPMIVTEKGNILPGYVPAQKLANILDKE